MKGVDSKLDGCGQFLKYSIFTVNVILFLGSLVVVGLGIWLLADGSRNATSTVLNAENTGMAPAIILLVFGAVVAIISFLGCCGAAKEIKCFLMTFFIIVLIITILFIAGVALLYKYKDEIKQEAQKELKQSMAKYYNNQDIRNAWDTIQKNLECCGVGERGFRDWLPEVPQSCKCTGHDDCDYDFFQGYWKDGCEIKIENYLNQISGPLFGVAIAVIIVMVLSMVFTCSLFLML